MLQLFKIQSLLNLGNIFWCEFKACLRIDYHQNIFLIFSYLLFKLSFSSSLSSQEVINIIMLNLHLVAITRFCRIFSKQIQFYSQQFLYKDKRSV